MDVQSSLFVKDLIHRHPSTFYDRVFILGVFVRWLPCHDSTVRLHYVDWSIWFATSHEVSATHAGIIDGRSLKHTESAQRDASLLSPLPQGTLNDVLVRLSLETTLWEAQLAITFPADTHTLFAQNFAKSNDTGTAWRATRRSSSRS